MNAKIQFHPPTCPKCGSFVIPVHEWYSNQSREVGQVIAWHCLGCQSRFDNEMFNYDEHTEGYKPHKRGSAR